MDECLRLILELVNVQDVGNVNLILESLAAIHHDKVKYGQIKTDFLLENVFANEQDLVDKIDQEQIFTERDRSFLSLFKTSLKTKSEYDSRKQPEDIQDLMDLPQHLLFSLYILKYLKAKDSKLKLLYTLNVFRTIQKRLALELREMGSRDRIMGDCNFLGPMENSKDEDLQIEDEADNEGENDDKPKTKDTHNSDNYKLTNLKEDKTQIKKLPAAIEGGIPVDSSIDIINGHLIDIQNYKFNDKFKNFIFSTNPLIPRYHSTFGEPLDR